jgi:hypothetical protein
MSIVYTEDSLEIERHIRAEAVKEVARHIKSDNFDEAIIASLRAKIDAYEASFNTRIWSNKNGNTYVIKSEAPPSADLY